MGISSKKLIAVFTLLALLTSLFGIHAFSEQASEAWKENVGSVNLSDLTVTGNGISVKENVFYITGGGDFEITGTNQNAMIHVNTTERVKLRLKGINLTNTTGPAIFFENCDKGFITVSKGSENYIADGGEYTTGAKAAVFSNDDLEIKGEGMLTVTSKSRHAIASDDDIKIEEGTLILTSENKDGIHANNTVKIQGGNIKVTSKGDGIQAEEDVIIEGGEINVTTTGEVAQTQNKGFGTAMPEGMTPPDGEMFQRPEGMNPPDEAGFQRPEGMNPPDGEMFQRPEGMNPPDGEMFQRPEGMDPPEEMADELPEQSQEDAQNSEKVSTKGIKGETNITITGGKITVNAADHAIHCASAINIKGGEMSLLSNAGKGISAHGDLVIDGGVINVLKSTEGLESKANLTINGGAICILSTDDGINTGGTSGRDVRADSSTAQTSGHDLTINGGTIFVNASGDGLDSNGTLVINGGNIVVEGPENNANGSVDSVGVIKVNSGTFIALGSAGMIEAPNSDSKQPTALVVTKNTIEKGTLITLTNSKGETIFSYTTIKRGNSIIFSSDKLTIGETYSIKAGIEEISLTLTDTVTTSSNGAVGTFGRRRGKW